MISLGLDMSTKATGVVVLTDAAMGHPILLHESTIKPKDLLGIARNTFICENVLKIVGEYAPDLVVIEGYSLNMRNASSVIPLVELGGLMRFLLNLDGHRWLAPRATELKKFVLGKGVGEKDQIMMSVLKRWGHTSQNNNTADAYVLACMGLAYRGKLKGMTQEMFGVIGKLTLVQD